jgi:hypothetical protein
MYAGWALLHAGAGVAAGSGWILAALPAAAGLVHRQVRREEQDLGADFGGEFACYRAAVPRYLGLRSFTGRTDRSTREGLRPGRWRVHPLIRTVVLAGRAAHR